MQPIVLTAEQRKAIERRRKQTLDRRVYQRLSAVLTFASGYSPEDIARLFGVDLAELGLWFDVFSNNGLDALCSLAADELNSSSNP